MLNVFPNIKRKDIDGNYFEEKENKLFQFVKTVKGCKINSIIWEDGTFERSEAIINLCKRRISQLQKFVIITLA